ncbi:winged helix-turn-helix transcriptional regulator [Planobispora takensis]|uniref:Transcriptional regulator n=1 Tax=Planobispora takensis TaxID=1367882 RepID=A0A8J3T3Q7_9ACTN|nr:helix-turn-helix domain-containing protein [Planobispora takensis]GII03841.1 transcriptional regulator [Planobispora takensis]
MKGYGQYCPIALGAEVFAERWTPIILRNLMVGCHRFRAILEGAPGLPRSVLSQRLRRLERDGVVERRQAGRTAEYHLTDAGHELAEVCMALGVWGARWREARPEHLDPYLALWTLTRLIPPASLPRPRIVVRFDLTDRSRPDRYWLVLTATGNEVCVRHPGFEEDGVVTTDAGWLVRWHSGAVPLAAAQRARGIAVTGPPWLVRALAAWGRLSPFARVRPAHETASLRTSAP